MEKKEYFVKADIKALDSDEKGVFEGYASTFGNLDSTRDIIARGAFKESLKNREPKVLWQHEMKMPCGKVLEAREDDKGLYVKVKLATETTLGKDAYEYLKAGIIDSLSIGFRCLKSEWDDENEIRTINEVELFEFSLVTIPANEMATIMGVKSAPETEREFEKFLRDNGFDRTAAKTITAKGYKGYQNVLRDAGVDTPDNDLRDADEVIKTLSNILQTLKGDNNVGGTKKSSG